jgi:hypothetical protein
MKRLFAALACALGALAIVGPAMAGVSVGVNDDAGKYSNGDAQFWQTMKQNGLKQNAVTVLWDETQPLTILDQSFLQKSLPAAQAAGIKVVFDVYPMHSQAFTKNGASPAQFGAFVKKLAQTFPQVTEYVVMNECNQTRFVNPQFDSSGNNQSAAICGAALAEGYDALKSVNPSIKVWGVGLSPRGNDNANATSNASTSPVNFLKALGAWYRQSGRSQPLMDGFDFHPYPIPQSLPFATGYADKENAAVSNLPRIYQAFYDGFKGTSQKTIGPGGLPVSLNEVGIQTDNSGKSGYTGNEVSGDANGGVRGDTATESFQASWYKQMLDYVACDPNIQAVNIFHLVDESDLGGWQSGLYYVGYQAKESASTVSQWISQTGGSCSGAQKAWTPTGDTTTPGGGTPTTNTPSPLTIALPSWAGSFFGPSSLTWPTFPGLTSLPSFIQPIFTQLGPMLQNVKLTVGLFYVGPYGSVSVRSISSAAVTAKAKPKPKAKAKTIVSKTVRVKKGKKATVALKLTKAQQKKLKAGYYKLVIDVKAVKGKAKGTLTSPTFFVGAGGKIAKK